MKVKGLLASMGDNYLNVIIEVFTPDTFERKEKYIIEPHSISWIEDIPENVQNSNVETFVLYHDSLSIIIWA